MTVPDTNIPSVPCVTSDVKVTIGGIQITAIPRIGALSFSLNNAVTSVMQQLNPALSQIKMVGDLVSVVTTLIDFAKAVPNAVKEGDPDILFDAIEAIKDITQKITPYIPATAFVATVFQSLALIKQALGAISVSLQQISTLFDEAAAALQAAQDAGNTSLETVANQMQSNAQASLDCAGTSLLAVLAPFAIITELAKAIPSPPQLPEIPDVAGKTVDELIEIVDNLYEALDAVT